MEDGRSRIEPLTGSDRLSILYPLSSVLDPLSFVVSQAEGERFELSQAEARRFSGPVHCQLCEPSAKREQEESNPHQRFWRPPCCQLHHAPPGSTDFSLFCLI
jgi:hypothetical protein